MSYSAENALCGHVDLRWLLFLKTATNTQEDWIKAGRAYVRASLAAAGLGLQMHPYSQVLQEYPENTELQPVMVNVGDRAPAPLVDAYIRAFTELGTRLLSS